MVYDKSGAKKGSSQFVLNFTASVLAFAVNAGIQLFITPVLTRRIGDEAYGFIAIANDFTGYANIFASVLNTVASRFISAEMHKGNYDKAERYFSSVLIGNLIISAVLAVLGAVIVFSFDRFLNISEWLVADARIVFILIFCSYILNILISIFTVSTFVKNRLELAAVRNICSYVVKLVVILILFIGVTEIRVYYVSLANLISIVFLGIISIGITKKIMPEIHFRFGKFDIALVWELIKTGIWMSVNNLALVFSNNFTTLLINIFIDPSSTGFYSAARLLPNSANSLMYTVYGIFCPTYVKLYAENKIDELKDYSVKSMKIMSLVLLVPFMVLTILGKDFLTLWQNFRTDEELHLMYILLAVSMMLLMLIAPVLSISQMGLTANNMKWQMINNLCLSIVLLVSTYMIVSRTQFGLIGIVAVMLIVQGGKWLFFEPLYAAYVLKINPYVFFKADIKLLVKAAIVGVILLAVNKYCLINSWVSLIAYGIMMTISGYVLYFCILFSKAEKKEYLKQIAAYIRR